MSKNLVITIGREFGSGGRAIAKRLAELMNIKMYDKELISLVAKNSGYNEEVLHSIDESATNSLLYTLSVGAGSHLPFILNNNAMPITDQAFIACSNIIKELAEKESCIIVGRCADSILKEHENLFTVFIHSDTEKRIDRICEYEKCNKAQASSMIKKADKRRSGYHNYYSETKWGDCRTYDLCINSKLGIENCARLIKAAAENR